MNVDATPSSPAGKSMLLRTLGTAKLVFFVIAAVAPLAAVIGVLPVALVFGSGPALPLAFAVTSLIVALFAVGYSAISREIVVGGAFYTYIAKGLGPFLGLGAACVAVFSYTAFVPGGLSYLGFVLHTGMLDIFKIDIGWLWYSLGAWVLVAALAYRSVDISSKVVSLLILVEFALLLILDAGVLADMGPRAFPREAMDLSALTRGAPGVSILLAFTCYFGIESAALYSEESRSPEVSVSRATYLAIAFIGVFYCLTSWITVGAVGPSHISQITADQVGTIYFSISDRFLSPLFTHVIQLALATSMFATVLSIHNVAARYMFVLGRQGCLPRALGRVHREYGAPYIASMTVTVISGAVVTICGLLGIHPMVGLGLVALGLAAVGVLFMQALTSIAVITFFKSRPGRRVWAHIVAPSLAAIGLAFGFVISIRNFEFLSGSENRFVNALPITIGLAFAIGLAYAGWLKRHRPEQLTAILNE